MYLLCIFNYYMCYPIQAHSAYCKGNQLTVSLGVEAKNIDFMQKASRQRR